MCGVRGTFIMTRVTKYFVTDMSVHEVISVNVN